MILRNSTGAVRVEARAAEVLVPPPGASTWSARVNAADVAGIPAFAAAVRVKAGAVATMRLGVFRGEGLEKTRAVTWQSKLFAAAPNPVQTVFGFWECVAESLAYRGNAYVWLNQDPGTGRVVEWWALHPDQVMVGQASDGRAAYRVRVESGYVDPTGRGTATYTLTAESMLHIRGAGAGGMLVAPSPVEVFAASLGAAVSRQKHEQRIYERGSSVQLAIELPQTMTRQQADEFRMLWRETYGGAGGDSTAVLGGGATLRPIGMTLVDAEFIASQRLTVEECARIVGVPASLVGNTSDIAQLEQELARLLRFGVGPELERIEDALEAHPALFPSGSRVYPEFTRDTFVRGDLMTEAQVMHMRVQTGIITPDEGRAMLGFDPLPDGLGAIPQVVAVGGSPAGMVGAAQPSGDASAASDQKQSNARPEVETRMLEAAAAAVVREGATIAEERERRVDDALVGLARGLEATAFVVNELGRALGETRAIADAARATVEQRAGDVVVNVEPTPITVEPVINLEPVVNVTVEHPQKGPESKTIAFRRDMNGRIVGAQMTEEEM